jgi:hypothetical protein
MKLKMAQTWSESSCNLGEDFPEQALQGTILQCTHFCAIKLSTANIVSLKETTKFLVKTLLCKSVIFFRNVKMPFHLDNNSQMFSNVKCTYIYNENIVNISHKACA